MSCKKCEIVRFICRDAMKSMDYAQERFINGFKPDMIKSDAEMDHQIDKWIEYFSS